MKKLTYFLLGTVGFFLVSCSQEDLSFSLKDGESNIILSLSTPQLQTRNYGKGESIDQLQYAIYEVFGTEGNFEYKKVTNPVIKDDFEGKTSLNLRLPNDHHYGIVFWADKKVPDSERIYTVRFEESGATMSVNYDNVSCNNDDLDGFFAFCDLGVIQGDKSVNADLYRPFAQINVGTNDFDDFENYGLTVTESSISINQLYTKLDLFTGKVDSEIKDVTFHSSSIPSHDIESIDYEKFPKDGYYYLAMAYILVGPEQETKTVTYGYTEGGDNVNKEKTKSIGDVTVKRNHRTNLYGSLLTGSRDANVEVKPGFGDGDEGGEIITVPDNSVKMEDTTYETLEAAISQAKDDGITDPIIYVGEHDTPINLNEEFDVTSTKASSAFENITIIGIGDPEKIVLEFQDDLIGANGVKLNFENITMKRPASGKYGNDGGPFFLDALQENYKNCNIEGCIALYIHDSASFDSCKFTNSESSNTKANGIYYYANDKTNVSVYNCEFDMNGKGILIYSTGVRQMDLTVENSVFKSSNPLTDKAAIQIQSENGCYGTVTIINTTATGYVNENNGLWNEIDNPATDNNGGIFVYKNNYDIYVDETLEQASQYFKVDEGWYLDAKTAFAAINNNSVVEFGTTTVAANTVTWPTNKTVTFIGKDEKSGINNIEWQAMTGCDLTVKNLTIDVLIRSGNHTSMGFKGLTKGTFDGVTFNGEWHTFSGSQTYKDCVFNYNKDSDGKNEGRYNCYNYSQDVVEFYDCKFNSKDNKALLVYDLENGGNKIKTAMHDMLIERCYFDSSNKMTSAGTAHAPVEIHTEYYDSYCTVTINNSSYNETNFSYRKSIWFEGENASIASKLFGPQQTKLCRIIVDGTQEQAGNI
ncbi:MAG: hypothetical protein J1D77_08285 [Muribaculaceae bacterium]|nr:hypothetical protein [Muribaculaceae bacterium]